MSVTTVLLHLLVVLVAAKLAAEIAERIGVPAVVGEILAGILIGPSALGLVSSDEVVRVLGEIGVILLLLEVGLEMDIAELASVGRAALLVAVVGVVVPFALGGGVGLAFGMSGNEALFVGAALTATSVGITARVFGDLKVLATIEARTVLGAAVADDVIGLVILTVVVRLVTSGSVSAVDVGQVVLIAVLFLVGASLVGLKVVPPAFHWIDRHSRSAGTLVAVALAFTLALAELANSAKLAPIVGAFVAGVVLSRSQVAERVRHELTPVGHLFIPVFFLQIGIDADISAFARPAVLGMAAALLAVAVAGKLVSPIGMLGSRGDRVLVGLAMIPRGEVGLIFATIGLQEHIFGEDVYASVLLVVLATTLLTPPLLRWRLTHGRRDAPIATTDQRPAGGWLAIESGHTRDLVELAAQPPVGETLAVALEAAQLVEQRAPGPGLLDWLATQDHDVALRWDRDSRGAFFALLRAGGPRSWRFLSITAVLDRALPELASAVSDRQAESYGFDPLDSLDWATLEGVRNLLSDGQFPLEHPEWVILAAAIHDAVGGDAHQGVIVARRVAQRLDAGAAAEQAVAGLLRDLELYSTTSRRLSAFGAERVQQLAQHVGTIDQATGLLVLALATDGGETVMRQRLQTLHERLSGALAHPELISRRAGNLVEARRAEAARLLGQGPATQRLSLAPRSFALSQPAPALALQVQLCERQGGSRTPLVEVHREDDGLLRIDIAANDQPGLLANQAHALGRAGFDVVAADLGVWDDGRAVSAFRGRVARPADVDALATLVVEQLRGRPVARPLPDASVSWDDEVSPWHSVLRVESPDEPGLLAAIAAAVSAVGLDIHSAHVTTAAGRAVDLFDVSGAHGDKVDQTGRDAVARVIIAGAPPPARWWAPGLGRRRHHPAHT